MPNYRTIADVIEGASPLVQVQLVRQECMNFLHKKNERNIILYYSGWLQKSSMDAHIRDFDMNSFMQASNIKEEERKKGLDLILHTPGGSISATESIGNYLRDMFNNDIRVIVPQTAMSGGTMWACMGKSIFMGKHSSLGAIDPQLNGIPALHIKKEIKKAEEEHPNKEFWTQMMSRKYDIGLYTSCEYAIEWSEVIARGWLREGMFANSPDTKKEEEVEKVVKFLSDGEEIYAHARKLNAAMCKEKGMNIVMLEDDQETQDAILSLHHACMWVFSNTKALKIVENHKGTSFIQQHE